VAEPSLQWHPSLYAGSARYYALVAGIFSLSTSTPHMFGERRGAFEADLRHLLHEINPNGIFSEQTREIAADIWRALG
jgi:hypothetical protein